MENVYWISTIDEVYYGRYRDSANSAYIGCIDKNGDFIIVNDDGVPRLASTKEKSYLVRAIRKVFSDLSNQNDVSLFLEKVERENEKKYLSWYENAKEGEKFFEPGLVHIKCKDECGWYVQTFERV